MKFFAIGQPMPCTNPPNGPGCRCNTAGILCTPIELDGFTFSMSSSPNLGGLPSNNLCPGMNTSSVPNNVNWFGFIAWCTDLTIDILVSNCQPGTNGNSYGVQIGLFGSCGSGQNGWNPIECITSSNAACGSSANYPTDHTINATGLTIGNVYYFMLDGCAGSYCDVTLTVNGQCGVGTINDWSAPVAGPLTTCVGNTDTYTVEDLDGAVEFYYYLNGTLIDDGVEQYSTDITWDTPRTYTLCVDVSNLPCIPESDDPTPNCIDIVVCAAADAGTITIDPNPACPNDVVTYTVSGHNTNPDMEQYTLVTDGSGSVLSVVNSNTGTFTHDQCANFRIYSYNLKVGGTAPTVGSNFPGDYPCTDNCCDIEDESLEFKDEMAPVFTDPPADETYDCFTDLPALADLEYTDNCLPTGMSVGIESGTSDLCTGGSITRMWEVTDDCGNTTTHTQNITITPIPVALFLTPPANITIQCDAIPLTVPDLTADNGKTGACGFNMVVPGVMTGSADLCGGVITNEWMVTDNCGRDVVHNQTITVDPVMPATWIDPPSDITVDCNSIPASAPDLFYSNGDSGPCEIAGSVPATMMGSAGICGGSFSFNWEFTDACGRMITNTQNVTVTPPPLVTFVSPPADITVDCANIPTSAPDLNYTNGLTGACEIIGSVPATMSGTADACGGTLTFTWLYTDVCGRPVNHTQNVTVTPKPIAAFVAPPGDMTVDCASIPTSAPDLSYTNGVTGACEIVGSVPAVMSGNGSVCGGTITYTWQFTDECGRPITHTQNITITPMPVAAFVDPPANTTTTCDNIPSSPPSLSYTNGASGACELIGTISPTVVNTVTACGGEIVYTWMFIDPCGRTTTAMQIITVSPAPEAVFASPPSDITIDCNDVASSANSLAYTNSLTGTCAIEGTIAPVRTGTVTVCGGTLVDTWSFTDLCGRTITETRNITVTPAPIAAWINPPADITIDCQDISSLDLFLNYSNGLSGTCQIMGSSSAIAINNYNTCGGTITLAWSFTDPCNRTINHTRNVTINPSPIPDFVNPPDDITLDCGAVYDVPPFLDITNNEFGDCAVTGQATITAETTNGNLTTYEWSFDHPCSGQVFTHLQNVTSRFNPELVVEPENATICRGGQFDLSTLDIIDLNNTSVVITFHSEPSAEDWNEIDPVVMPNAVFAYYIKAVNDDGCVDIIPFPVFVDEPINAGEDVQLQLCRDGSTLNLYDYLSNDANLDGFWLDLDFNSIDVSDAYFVNINNVAPDFYNFYYLTEEYLDCPSDTAIITLEILDEVPYVIEQTQCSSDNSTYFIKILKFGNTVTSSAGVVNSVHIDTAFVTGIPIGTQVTLTITNGFSGCSQSITINSPNCDCPTVAKPTGTSTYKICETDVPLVMSVSLGSGLQANWYDTPSNQTPLSANSLTFNHTNATQGLYYYYVEALDPATLCVSQERLKIEVEVVRKPTVVNVNPKICDDNTDGFMSFDLEALKTQINPNPSNTIVFYLNSADANSEINPLASPYNNIMPNQVIFAVVKNATGCKSIGEITLTVLAKPTFDLLVKNESCLGRNDGIVTISNIVSNGNVMSSLSNNTFRNELVYDSLSVKPYNIRLRDTSGCVGIMDFEVEAGMKLQIASFSSLCDNNGTLTDATDDTYTITFNITNSIGITGNYILNIGNINSGVFAYNSTHSITIPSDGTTKLITFEDEINGCTVTRNVGPLNPCSTSCIINIDALTYECNDNGTATDPTDDFYEVSLTASSINGSAGNTYVLFVDGVVRGAGTYGQAFVFNVNNNQNDVELLLQDSDDNQCQASSTLLNLIPCSDGCSVSLAILSYECDNNGTILDKTDDTYLVKILAKSVNTGSATYNLTIDGGQGSVYNYNDTITLTMPADGLTHLLNAIDVLRPECMKETSTKALTNCSTDCEIVIVMSNLSCDNNGTNDNDTDDTYTFTLLITGGKGNMWSIEGTTLTGAYGSPINLGPYNISDGPLTLSAIDADIPECTEDITITPPPSCSGCIQTMSLEANGEINCVNPSVDLLATVSEAGTYLWSFQGGEVSTDLNGSAGTEGYYVFEVVFPDNCSLVDSVFVNSDDNIPTANAGQDKVLNCDIDSVVLDGGLSSSGANLRYEWTDEAGNILGTEKTITATSPGNFFLQIIDDSNNCNSAKDRVVVQQFLDIPSTAIYANPGEEFDCIIAEIILTTDNEPNVIYDWLTPETTLNNTQSISVTEIGEYVLIATNVKSLCIDSSSITILSFQEYPIIELSVNGDIDCDTEFVTLSSEGSQTGENISYTWYDPNGVLISQQPMTLNVEEAGQYTLVLADSENGCTNEDSIEVVSIELEVGIEIDPIIEVKQGQTIVLKPIINIPDSEIASVIWDPSEGLSCSDCLEPTVLVEEDKTYTVTVTDIYGCVGTAVVSLRALIKSVISIPNILLPGSGNGNGVFVINSNDDLATLELVLIFDRWGNKVYSSTTVELNNPAGAWDGRFNGENVVPGVYVYFVKAKLSTGENIELSGDVTVIK